MGMRAQALAAYASELVVLKGAVQGPSRKTPASAACASGGRLTR